MSNIYTNSENHKIVEIDTVVFNRKSKIDWDGVENYLKKYIGKAYMIDETNDIIYIDSDFPNEYANSRYSTKALGTIGKAKANASQVIPELIKIATNIIFQENTEPKHAKNAKYGWYRCTVRFSLPISDSKGNIIGKNFFQGRMIIRHAYDGKKYLYDIIDIKKEM
ncbi:MAG: hypothetical protein NC094_00160 [Bacteroidales bacterium]|nr:hypothetical protein [Lachnoclostridium sp.]MCM1384656.1 hypothetical protein [Lachnoclostridium sp.]MCM1463805.1 hypothetical protein [Bacteroidales bacterium]